MTELHGIRIPRKFRLENERNIFRTARLQPRSFLYFRIPRGLHALRMMGAQAPEHIADR
jgi:hypothetical protein